ncbi:MAG TPA: GH92 family glycosyl hydrolase [Bacteroidales bacterium]|nr:GH92 family glycosyl hydrolase [Bacteroidales bacterium]HSA44171.1 GH92 family glycosyl hydrolase [Bacteroidales bacterium]
MNKIPFPLLALVPAMLLSVLAGNSQTLTPAAYVNPFIGTGGHGHTYPGPCMPFGMVQLSPDTRLTGWDGCSGYHYSDSVIYGFSHTHLSGTGCSDYGDILLQPFSGAVQWKNTDYSSVAGDEKAETGYYSVMLKKHRILAELSVTLRTGIHRYTYASVPAGVLLDLQHRDEVIASSLKVTGNNEVRGMRRSKAWADDQLVYFVIRFSRPIKTYSLAADDQAMEGSRELEGKNLKAAFFFDLAKGENLLVKVGISAVSEEGAARNLDAEQPGWDFGKVRQEAAKAWNKELGKIMIEDPDEEAKTVFYTALYHCMLAPNLYMDVDGQYRGRDMKVHQAEGFDYYTVFSLWDTYRAAHPLFTIIDRKRTNDFIRTFIAQYEQGGLLPVWELSANETFCMIGYHAVPVIADAWLKGIRDYDTEKAFQAMVASASTDKYGLPLYRELGYIPGDKEGESVSKTLEYAYDDWCIAQVASHLQKKEESMEFSRRAQSWKNVFDPQTAFMRPRINGGWLHPFDPKEVNNHYTEANAWQYSFYVPQDIDGLMKAMGGKQQFILRLDELFSTSSETSGRNQADITGLIGQYAHGNEPSHHMAYLYNYAGQAWKTQQLADRIMRELYHNASDGLSGNEDCGQMSAWYVLSALGFYPVCPGNLQYAIGSPLFSKATVKLENGNSFIIEANNRKKENCYINALRWNGQAYIRSYIPHKLLMDGGHFVFNMSHAPNIMWAMSEFAVPRTMMNNNLILPVPYIQTEAPFFSDTVHVRMGAFEPGSEIHYTLDQTVPTEESPRYAETFRLTESSVIRAFAVHPELGKSRETVTTVKKIPGGRSIRLFTAYENQYTAGGPNGLINGIRGTVNWRLGNWQGYLNTDLDALVDLGKVQHVNTVSIGFLQDIKAWIWFPREVNIAVSADGVVYEDLPGLLTSISDRDETPQIKDYSFRTGADIRYIRVKAKQYGTIPSWHSGAGEPSHLFVDEVVIE